MTVPLCNAQCHVITPVLLCKQYCCSKRCLWRKKEIIIIIKSINMFYIECFICFNQYSISESYEKWAYIGPVWSALHTVSSVTVYNVCVMFLEPSFFTHMRHVPRFAEMKRKNYLVGDSKVGGNKLVNRLNVAKALELVSAEEGWVLTSVAWIKEVASVDGVAAVGGR